VAVRKAANGKGAGYPDDLVGTTLMRRAFHPESGPLTDMSLVVSEREAEMHLFSGAIGHGKNPPSHRDVEPAPQEAARLIVFASHLLSIGCAWSPARGRAAGKRGASWVSCRTGRRGAMEVQVGVDPRGGCRGHTSAGGDTPG
jgi:hypothetical protein